MSPRKQKSLYNRTYLSRNAGMVMKVKPEINSGEIHPQQGNERHPVDDDDGPGGLVGGWVGGSLWPKTKTNWRG